MQGPLVASSDPFADIAAGTCTTGRQILHLILHKSGILSLLEHNAVGGFQTETLPQGCIDVTRYDVLFVQSVILVLPSNSGSRTSTVQSKLGYREVVQQGTRN